MKVINFAISFAAASTVLPALAARPPILHRRTLQEVPEETDGAMPPITPRREHHEETDGPRPPKKEDEESAARIPTWPPKNEQEESAARIPRPPKKEDEESAARIPRPPKNEQEESAARIPRPPKEEQEESAARIPTSPPKKEHEETDGGGGDYDDAAVNDAVVTPDRHSSSVSTGSGKGQSKSAGTGGSAGSGKGQSKSQSSDSSDDEEYIPCGLFDTPCCLDYHSYRPLCIGGGGCDFHHESGTPTCVKVCGSDGEPCCLGDICSAHGAGYEYGTYDYNYPNYFWSSGNGGSSSKSGSSSKGGSSSEFGYSGKGSSKSSKGGYKVYNGQCSECNCLPGHRYNFGLKICESCGAPGEVCCEGGLCDTGSICDPADETCSVCGGDPDDLDRNLACCEGDTCKAGFICNAMGMCEPCGRLDDVCCDDGHANLLKIVPHFLPIFDRPSRDVVGTVCDEGLVCRAATRTCVECGGLNNTCCDGNTCKAGFKCNATSMCEVCGTRSQLCCDGDEGSVCDAGLACRAATGTCDPCGGAMLRNYTDRQICCDDNACRAGFICTSVGICEPCGFNDEVCCEDNKCKSGFTCSACGKCVPCGLLDEDCCDVEEVETKDGCEANCEDGCEGDLTCGPRGKCIAVCEPPLTPELDCCNGVCGNNLECDSATDACCRVDDADAVGDDCCNGKCRGDLSCGEFNTCEGCSSGVGDLCCIIGGTGTCPDPLKCNAPVEFNCCDPANANMTGDPCCAGECVNGLKCDTDDTCCDPDDATAGVGCCAGECNGLECDAGTDTCCDLSAATIGLALLQRQVHRCNL